MQMAFAWHKAVIGWYLRCELAPASWSDACLSCLRSLTQLLESNSSSAQKALNMYHRVEEFLIVGACMVALDITDPTHQLVLWVHEHHRVLCICTASLPCC